MEIHSVKRLFEEKGKEVRIEKKDASFFPAFVSERKRPKMDANKDTR